MLLAAASLAMLLTNVPSLTAQEVPGGAPGSSAPSVQPEPTQKPAAGTPVEPLTEPPAETPVEPSVRPPAGAPGTCDHAAGEFLVGYVSEEALHAAPQENVAETFDGILAQHLVYDEIKNIPDPDARLAAEEAKRQEIAARPSVAYVEYNCVAGITQAASGESIPLPASCGDCGKSVVEGARKIIADGFEGAGSKDAFDAALEAARPANAEDNVASASEIKLDEEAADGQHADAADSSVDSSEDGADSSAADDGGGTINDETGTGESGEKVSSASNDDEVAADGEDAPSKDTKGTSGDTEAASDKGKDTGAGALGTRSVSGKNAAASEEPRAVSSPGVLALGAGALLLTAGVIVGRRILRG